MNTLATRNRPTTSPPPLVGVVGRFRAASKALPSEATQRRPGDGERIVRLAAQRLDELGLTARATVLRELASAGDVILLRAEGFYDLLRIDTPDSERPALLLSSARFIAHNFAQGVA